MRTTEIRKQHLKSLNISNFSNPSVDIVRKNQTRLNNGKNKNYTTLKKRSNVKSETCDCLKCGKRNTEEHNVLLMANTQNMQKTKSFCYRL